MLSGWRVSPVIKDVGAEEGSSASWELFLVTGTWMPGFLLPRPKMVLALNLQRCRW